MARFIASFIALDSSSNATGIGFVTNTPPSIERSHLVLSMPAISVAASIL